MWQKCDRIGIYFLNTLLCNLEVPKPKQKFWPYRHLTECVKNTLNLMHPECCDLFIKIKEKNFLYSEQVTYFKNEWFCLHVEQLHSYCFFQYQNIWYKKPLTETMENYKHGDLSSVHLHHYYITSEMIYGSMV